MEELPKYYKILFNAVTDVIEALDRQNFGVARDLLVKAQQRAEEQYLSEQESTGAGL